MKRDMDLIRAILLRVEAGENSFAPLPADCSFPETFDEGWSALDEAKEKLSEHISIMEERGLIKVGRLLDGDIQVERLTWEGHEFLDSVRDPKIWKLTKEGALAGGGWTFDLLGSLAKGFIQKQIEERTGIKL